MCKDCLEIFEVTLPVYFLIKHILMHFFIFFRICQDDDVQVI